MRFVALVIEGAIDAIAPGCAASVSMDDFEPPENLP